MTAVTRCEPRRPGDVLDEQLAARLNELATRREPEYAQSMRPVLIELGTWMLLAVLLAVATVGWVV